MNEGMVGGDISQEGKRTYLVREWAPTAKVPTRFLSESHVTMTDRPPESTEFRGSIKFRHKNLLIRREA